MHPSTKYWHIIINFDVDMAMTLVIWLETQARSYMVGHIVNQVFSKVVKTHVYHFSWQLVHVRGRHAQVLHFLFFFIFFDIFQNWVKFVCMQIHCKTLNLWKLLVVFAILTTWVPLNYFWQNLRAIYHALVVQIWPNFSKST